MEKIHETALFMQRARKKLRITQTELAKKIGTAPSNVNKYEKGKVPAPGWVVLRVQSILIEHKRKRRERNL